MRKKTYLIFVLSVLTLSSCFYRGNHKPLIGGIREYRETRLPADDYSSTPSTPGTPSTSTTHHSTPNNPSTPNTQHSTPSNPSPSTLELPGPMSGVSEQILYRTGYVTSYNKDHRIPNWTAWHLTADHTTGPYKRKGVSYREDEDVPAPRATTFDYQQSGYDRGHMCPSGDNKWDPQAQQDCFLLTNMCPQNHNLNGGDWNELEMKCRKWAERYGDLYIICGPILYRQKHKTIGRARIVVPEAFFKVVLRMSPEPAAIGFIYKNEDGNRPMGDYTNTIRQVERITGIDFFPQLPDDIEEVVENQASLDDWR